MCLVPATKYIVRRNKNFKNESDGNLKTEARQFIKPYFL